MSDTGCICPDENTQVADCPRHGRFASAETRGGDLTDYERGYLNGLWEYAWWKDGTAYVGTSGTTYKRAVERFLAERGKEGWSIRFAGAVNSQERVDA